MKKIFLSFWTASLIPIATIALIDYKIIINIGGQLPPSITTFALHNPGAAISTISSQVTFLLILTLLAPFLVSMFLIISIFRIEKTRRRIVLSPILIILAIVFLTLSNTTSCQFISSSSEIENQIQKLHITAILGITSNPFCQISHAQLNKDETDPSSFNNKQINKLLEIQSNRPLTLAPDKGTKKNIVVIVMESVERDKTTAYNPDILTTPFLAKISQEGIRIDNVYVNSAWTSKSLVSINCGNPPNITIDITESSPNGIKENCLPKLLKPLGYNSAFFQSATRTFENRAGLINNIGYDNFTPLENLDRTGWTKIDPLGIEERSMIKPIMQWVDKQENPFLLSLITLSGHRYTSPPNPSFPQLHLSDNKQENNYLNAVRYVDLFLFELFSEFKQRELLDNTLFLFTSDTGNHMKFKPEDNSPFESHIKIPLLIWDNTLIKKPQTIPGIWQHSDILPTIIDLLDFNITSGLTYGSSMLQKQDPDKNIHLVCKAKTCLLRIDNKNKFVYKYNDKKPEMYDNDDANIENNIIEQLTPQIIKRYSAELKAWEESVAALY